MLLKSFIEGLPHEGEILLIVLISDPVFVKMERPMPIYKIRAWSLIYQHCFFELSLIFELFPACFRLPPCPSKFTNWGGQFNEIALLGTLRASSGLAPFRSSSNAGAPLQ